MSSIDDIMSSIPISALAERLGVDDATAESAVRQALPALVGGMQANATDPGGAASLASALDQHSPRLVDGGVDLGDVDTGDGEKIVGHVFGQNSGAVAQTLGGNLGGNSELVKQLLPILAPIVLSYLSQKLRGGAAQPGATSGGGLNDLLGSILGGLAGQAGQQTGQPTGQTPGQQSGAGSILDMLGGLLGGGRR